MKNKKFTIHKVRYLKAVKMEMKEVFDYLDENKLLIDIPPDAKIEREGVEVVNKTNKLIQVLVLEERE